MSAPTDYASSLAHLRALGRAGIDLRLDRVRRVAEGLGNPQLKYATILVAGTNGKGSTCAMLDSMLGAAGYRCGLYTSPHLVRETERVRVCGSEITPQMFAESARAVYEAAEKAAAARPPGASLLTAFEFLTLLAFDALARAKVEIAVIEVGLGGRLDATNIVDPLVTVIAPISMDHEQYLGDTLEAISHEKAGILRSGIPLIHGSRHHEVRRVIAELCRHNNVPLKQAGSDFDFLPLRDQHMHYAGFEGAWRDLKVGLSGMHQLDNAAMACAVAEVLADTKFPVSTEAVREGLQSVRWRGRMETLSTQPLVLCDGAHNRDAARSLRRYLEQYVPFRKIHLIVGHTRDRDVEAFLSILAPVAARVTLTQTSDGALADPESLLPLALRVHKNVVVEGDLSKILRQIYWRKPEDELIVVTGSLYLVGETIGLLESGEIEGFESARGVIMSPLDA